ncbi:MAG: transcription-repair coupling factor [Lachnospiraceae bacterium]|jgi:transcription-repair coupling factor (superfamily II helicase)
MNIWTEPLKELEEYQELLKKVKKNKGILQVSGCLESQKAHLLYGISQQFSHCLILAENDLKAKELYEDYRFYQRDVIFYPAKDLLFFQADIRGNLLVKERMKAVVALLEGKHVTVITSIDGCMDYLRPLQEIKNKVLHFDYASELNLDQLKRDLVELGYEYCGQVEVPGQFSVRGGIVDIFPLTEENPWRIELWGDEIDSIRSFDAASQRSIENLEEITIYPAAELEAGDSGDTFLDYFPREDTIIMLDEPVRLEEKGKAVELEFRESVKNQIENDSLMPDQAHLICGFVELAGQLNRRNCVAVCTMEHHFGEWEITGRYHLSVRSVNGYHNSFDLLVKDLKAWKKQGYRVVLLSGSRTRAARLAQDLQEEGLNSFYSEDESRQIQPGEILVRYGSAHRGFEYPLIRFVLITETDIFGKEKKKKRKKIAYNGDKIQSFSELSVGDYVVHENHGLGVYRGIEKVTVDKVVKDYIKIEYAGKSNLYILATQLDALQKYAGADAKKPKLNKLGGQEWNKTKSRVRGAVQNIAKDLVELYAVRQEKTGFVYGPDTVWQREFEEMFPYEETEDQLLAIEATKRDMESSRIMDRLICGDVGYGKTEIAIRAAFKAIQEGKQVVYLVPTTILAQQHYNTFVQRMKEFPVRVDLLCRFKSAAEQKKTITDLKKGLVDIVIGTHRVLSKDVAFKDLGLLVIDEEQRFGVTHKEKIKKLKENVDVLTLTATPIPRTLHMSLIGIRDMSVLEEAPQDRLPIQTYVMEYNEEMVRAAISRELARDGQVYYVYNRVKDIDELTNRIAKLVPEANVAFAHGQMNERELEKIMYGFINGEIDVLVSTTIIETGLDISNVNTMIIHDADQLGLSQLYQLRGRVGRSNRTAYAFLMYRRNKMLKEVAEKRLHAIREFTELGSGFKIAMRDLEIRGAGNLLGAEQHGHMEAVGYDLYCKMLNEAVKEAKGIRKREDFETTMDLDMDAFIPEKYIPNEYQKLDIYKRIAGIENQEEYEDMMEELLDRFGEPPKSVQNLLAIANLKALAHKVYMTEVKQTKDTVRLVMYEKARMDPAGIPKLLDRYARELKMKVGEAPVFLYTRVKNGKEQKGLLEGLADIFTFLADYTDESL